MTFRLILASGSAIRREMLENAGVAHEVQIARIDEETIRRTLLSEGAKPRDVADALAEMKAIKVSDKRPEALVLGCDQVIDFGGEILSKPETRAEAKDQLIRLRSRTHQLLSAAVICEDGRPIWRHVGVVRIKMRDFSDAYLETYLDRNWPDLSDSVGGYKIEKEGVRLFSRVEGDYFTVLGLPLIELLTYLTVRGELQE